MQKAAAMTHANAAPPIEAPSRKGKGGSPGMFSDAVRAGRARAGLLAGTAILAALAFAPQARAQPAPNARPLGGSVTAGAATIANTATTTTITQTTQRAAINWNSFNVGAKQTVDFVQPSSNAVALNRVVGPNPSQIAGRIDANGQVILINQDGVTFYKGAQVNTAGLVVSAAGMTDKNFMAGRMVFDQAAHPGARIDNAGTITVAQAGLAALVAPQVANSGVINAKLGHVVLAGAMTHTLDLYGDGLVAIDVTGQVTHGPGGGTALVTNSGTIMAEGGTVQLTARAADGVVQTLIDAGGSIAAPSRGSRTGTILVEGIGGNIAVSGNLLAQGTQAGTQGGKIQILPSGTASIAKGAVIDASGAAGGGTVALGTTLARATGGAKVKPTRTSRGVTLAAGARIAADATGAGNGGHVTVLSTDSTVMAGGISVRGGPGGGDGGFVEISGGTLGFSGVVDLSAPRGAAGTVLFDPGTLDIVAGANGTGADDSTLTRTGIIPSNLHGTNSTTTVSAGALESIGSGNILLQAQTLVDVQASVNFTTTGAVALQSFGSLVVEPTVTLNANTTAGLTLISGTAGTITLTGATLLAPTVSLQAGSGGISLGTAVISTALLGLTANSTGAVTQGAGSLDVTTLTGAVAGGVALGSTLNSIGTLDKISGGPSIGIAAGGAMTVYGPLIATNLTLSTATGDLTLAGDLIGPTSVALTASHGNVTQTAGLITTNSLSAHATGSLDLFSTLNTIGTLTGASAGAGVLRVADSGNLTVQNAVSGPNVTLEVATSGGTLALGGSGIATSLAATASGGTMLLTADRITDIAGDSIAAGTPPSTGSVTIAPYTATAISLGGTAGAYLLVDSQLLGAVSTGTLTVGSSITASAISVDGPIGVAGNLRLLTAGDITEPGGGITAATLLGHAGGSIALGSTLNAIATLGSMTAGPSLLVVNGSALTVNGPLDAAAVTLSTRGGDLTLAGTIAGASTVSLSAAGNVIEGAGGAITGFGVLSGQAGLAFDIASPLNSIGTLGAITAGTALTVVNASGLAVAGALSAETIGLTSTGDLGLSGSLTGTTGIALTAAGGASISQTGGSLSTATLTAGAGGSIDLFSTLNAIGAVAGASAGTGALRLANGGNLTLENTLSGTGATIEVAATNDVLALGSGAIVATLSAHGGGAVLLTADRIADIAGDSIAAGTVAIAPFSANAVSLAGTPGAYLLLDATLLSEIATGTLVVGSTTKANGISLDGPFTLTGTLDLLTSGNITEPGAPLAVGTLLGNAGGSIALGSTLNAIGTLGDMRAGPSLLVANGSALAVNGSLNAASVTLSTLTGDLTLAGTIAAGTAVSLTATAGNVSQGMGGAITGLGTLGGRAGLAFAVGSSRNAIGTIEGIFAGTALTVVNATSLAVAGAISASTVGLTTTAGGIVQSGGGVIAATLTGNSFGAFALSSSLNAIGTLGDIAAGTSLRVANGSALAVNGSLNAASVTLSTLTGDLTLAGTIAAGTATSLTATAGNVSQGASGAVTGLGMLEGHAALGFAVGSTLNSIGTLGSITAGGAISVVNTTSLAVTGPISADTVGLTSTGDLGLSGHLTGTTSIVLSATGTGSIGQTGGGLTTGALTAGAGGSIDLFSTLNAIGTVTGATAGGGALRLASAGNLTLETTLSGTGVTIEVAATNDVLSLGSGAIAATLNAGASGIALTADRITDIAGDSLAAGTVSIAPFSANAVSLAGTPGAYLLLDATLLSEIATGTLVVGSTTKANGISLDGPLTLAGTLDLLTSGSIIEPGGPLSVPVLAASAGGGIALGAAHNAIGTLAPVAALGGVSIVDGGAMTVAGAIGAGSVTLAAGGMLDVLAGIAATTRLSLAGNGLVLAGAAPVTAAAIQLNGGAGGIAITGGGTIGGGATTLDLIGGGGVSEASTSTIAAALLTSSTGIGGSVALLGRGNAIATLGGFAVSGGDLSLAENGTATLLVSGPVSAGNVTLGTPGGLPGTISVAGAMSATHTLALNAIDMIALTPAATIDAPAITLASIGPITLAAGALVGDPLSTVGLSSTGGAVLADAGSRILAATLDSPGGIAGAADLAGTANAIATLENLSAGSLTLQDGGAPLLTIAGHVGAGGAVAIGTVAPSTAIALTGSLAAAAITLAAASGGMALSGSLMAVGVAELDAAAGGIAQSGGFVAGTLQSTGVVGPVAFGNANIATLGAFGVTGGDFSLHTTTGLTIAGPVSAANIAIASQGGIAVAGTLAAAGALGLSAGAGGIALGGANAPALLNATTVTLASQGPVSEPNGRILAITLTDSGAASVDLGNPANQVPVLGAVSLSGGGFLFADSPATALTIAGPVRAANATIGTPATLTLAGAITVAGELTLAAGAGGIGIGTGGAAATVNAGTLVLASAGGIAEPNGVVTAGELVASSASGIDLGNPANDIAALGAVTVASGDLLLADNAAPLLTVFGPVSAADVTLATPNALLVAGTISDAGQIALSAGAGGITIGSPGAPGRINAGTLILTSGGAIGEPNGGIVAATLTGASAGATVLDGSNSIAQLAGFTAGTAFSLADSAALTISGTLRAPLVAVQDPAVVTLAGGATIVTGGTAQPADFLRLDASPGGAQILLAQVPTLLKPAVAGGQPAGAYFSVGGFTQLGTSTVTSITSGGADILRIDAAGTGNIAFGSLQGPATWLLLGIAGGRISGSIFVQSLTLQYPAGYSGAELSGSISNINGQAAAGQATILPLPNSAFRLNNCPIHSINCVLLPIEVLPAASPLQNFTIGTLLNDDEDDSLLLPIVSSRDY